MTSHVLKLSLGLLFGISNILSWRWRKSKTYLKEKKIVDDHGYAKKKKIEKKKKNHESKFLVS